MELRGADVGNAYYLEAKTKEKAYIVAGPEFGSLEGHTLLIDKGSGLCGHQRFVDALRDMGSFQSSEHGRSRYMDGCAKEMDYTNALLCISMTY